MSIKLIASIYKYIGDTINDFLKDVKESTWTVIDDTLAKTEWIKVVEPPKEISVRRGWQASLEWISFAFRLIPWVDVSKELSNSKLIEKLRNTNWKIKSEGYRKVEEVMAEAKNRILPNGLSDLFGALKQGLVDKNKAVLKSCLQLIAKVAKALDSGAKHYTKEVMTTVL